MQRLCWLNHDGRYEWCPYCPTFFQAALETVRRFLTLARSPAQCKHERTYYDEKGERCRDCGVYVKQASKGGDIKWH